MHLLAATPGAVSDGSEAIDLGQSPAAVVVLSAADSELACLAQARAVLGAPELRLASLLHLAHPMSVDLYVDQVIRHARLVVVRLLGGRGYWPYGVEQLAAACRQNNVQIAFLPGDDQPDPDLAAWSSLPPEALHRLWQYLVQGGAANAEQFLRYCSHLTGAAAAWREPAPLPPAGLYPAGADLESLRAGWTPQAPVAALVVYRALVQAGNTAAIEALCAALAAQGLNPLPLYVTSLKDPVSAATIAELLRLCPPDIILNATGFAVAAPGRPQDGPFAEADCPVLQVIFSGGGEQAWRDGVSGLSARDIAMNVALPEVDGRIIGRAVSFKAAARRDEATQCDIVAYQPLADRVVFMARLAAAWAGLRRKPAAERRIALILANYPNRDGRLGNGVGLDTPAATVEVLRALQGAGVETGPLPADAAALMALVQQGVTNALSGRRHRLVRESLALPDYMAFFHSLPAGVQKAVSERWGAPERDPHFTPGELSCGHFDLALLCFGHVAVGVQPARGYHIDPASSYHDPALVPPHGYLAFYAWLREQFRVDAVVHMGKHGNLEWLPGKSLALSETCFPEAVLGPLPHLYPFIVNDPGEGTQAKRRAQAVIIDHLTPPLTRAESYGPLRQLEQLVDEYYEAAAVDPRRLTVLRDEILALTRITGLDKDCGIAPDDSEEQSLQKLDNHLCELKEMQIRDGLHIFGRAPEGEQLTDLLVALARAPRGAAPREASLLRALADDLGLGFDPLDCPMAQPWSGPRPALLAGAAPWRSTGDTVERLEDLARALVAGAPRPPLPAAAPVLDWIDTELRPAIAACGEAEIAGLLRGLAGRFVPPGPSGAPTRGRPDVLPTGRNFYSVDSRTVPTPAAWTLGWKSATLLIERHLQEHGAWPRSVAVSAWGTSNMRTGGDDIAQGLALMGVRPTWDAASRRVTGFEILPLSLLDRPRVDVTLRVSGFFRDAFPALMDLFDSAARAVAALEESDDDNPLAAHVREDARRLAAEGHHDAARRAGHRVFGSKPGAYGAGLQALIDEKGWSSDADLARAYIAWGGYAYGGGAGGDAAHGLFETRLRRTELVLQNQDNREHDLLDSDDYYQFEGGMTAAVRVLSGQAPAVYHADHSRPDSPRIRTLEEEIARVVRARVVNPKWIAGVMRHGYKGAFEMAATVDYLFAFAATAHAVGDHHFDAVFEAYLEDPAVLEFLRAANPAALREMIDRLDEAIRRGLWHPRRNHTIDRLRELA
ncbi:aerobic cobaltochelatase subunit CobN [mine drainage metagenome]|uniref:Aerobic cobaltochelatase subunit CobN n=1 Tax=mine drainage metagenome TaxID=410659 RepID=A0A1J5TAN0_9ZZZZ